MSKRFKYINCRDNQKYIIFDFVTMKRRVKILYTIPNFDTAGSGKVVYDLVQGIDRGLFEPEICVFHTRGEYFKEVEKLNVPIHVFNFTTSLKPYASLFYRIYNISRFFKKHKFDIIHSWHWSSDFTEPLAAKLAGIPWLYTKKAMGWGNKSWKIRSYLSTKIIAINQDMMDEFFATMLKKTIKLPLGLNTDYYQPSKKNALLVEELNISPTDFVIVSVVNMVPVKGIEILIKAVNEINNPSLKLLIVGNIENDYAKGLIKENSNKNILFLGKKIDVRPYLSLADLFVIPTKNEGKREGMPVAPLEAMAMGVPVIGSNVSGVKDILEDYPDMLFEASDIEFLKQKINDFMNNTNHFDKTKMVRNIQQKYGLQNFIKSRESIYTSIVNR